MSSALCARKWYFNEGEGAGRAVGEGNDGCNGVEGGLGKGFR